MDQRFVQYKEIEDLLTFYFGAIYNGDIETLKSLFIDEATMYGYKGDELILGSTDQFFNEIANRDSMSSTELLVDFSIKHMDVVGKIATAIIYVSNYYGECSIFDNIQLIKVDGTWKIACKTIITFDN